MRIVFLSLGLAAFTVGVVGAFLFGLSTDRVDQAFAETFRHASVAGAVLAGSGLLAPRPTPRQRPPGPPSGHGGPPPYRG